ncbi:MAG: DUF3575 domain-containing protein [Firmicutes bacterium]|nr:DUF3575 domain-containing protein [Bacillota bacterium]MCM1401771.1 DUF3575 domain-containing protein [Bacteroides sp.]MCM1477912.1 DUF3575 domain-containing protein [Bacteroides sp.]
MAVTLLAIIGITAASAQNVAVKTNLLSDFTLTANGAVEVKLAPKWTSELSGNLNAWTIDSRNWRQWSVMPEARYWFCQAFSGHFVGAHVFGGQYNYGHLNLPFKFLGTDFNKLKDHRFQGWMVGAGIAYGYSWILDRHWNIEAEIGFGWAYTRYDEFECRDCGERIRENRPHNYVGPTKAALNLIYTF